MGTPGSFLHLFRDVICSYKMALVGRDVAEVRVKICGQSYLHIKTQMLSSLFPLI